MTNLKWQNSFSYHDQNSWYGLAEYNAQQTIGFSQLTLHKKLGEKHNLLNGLALRYNNYNDNTSATTNADSWWLPGLFIQDNFKLTKNQNEGVNEILSDLHSNNTMIRMLQGDVGSGKTIVALITMLISISDGSQSVLLVPTEILAIQHFNTINKLLKPLNIEACLLLGESKTVDSKKARLDIIENIANGSFKIIIGTHALISKKINYKNLLSFISPKDLKDFGLFIDKESNRIQVDYFKKMNFNLFYKIKKELHKIKNDNISNIHHLALSSIDLINNNGLDHNDFRGGFLNKYLKSFNNQDTFFINDSIEKSLKGETNLYNKTLDKSKVERIEKIRSKNVS